jgi:hypothetical protein
MFSQEGRVRLESRVTVVLLVFLISAFSLGIFLWAGSLFLQGYIYTEPSPGLAWQAPASGAALGLFYALWTLLVVRAEGASARDIPYDTLFRFSPTVEKYKTPVKELWLEQNKKREKFVYNRGRDLYVSASSGKPSWPHGKVDAIVVKEGNEEIRFEPVDKTYTEFRDGGGWIMGVFEGRGPTGMPVAFQWGLFLGNLLLNFVHLGLWFVCLWLLLRFQWSHALGLAVVMWLVVTLTILPIVLDQAGIEAEKQRSPRAAQADTDVRCALHRT